MTSIDPRIFRAYDIRGKAHEQLTEEASRAIGQMFGTILRERYGIEHPQVIVGRDARTHSPALLQAAMDGLMSAGCTLYNIGQTPTPINYFTVCNRHADAGLQVTASHNGKEDNGLKLQLRDAEAYSGDDLQYLRQRIEQGTFAQGDGSTTDIDAITPYLAAIAALFPGVGKGKKVVVDTGNGVAGPVYTEALRRAGCTVIELYTEPDGTFPNHPADPSVHATLRELQQRVVQERADIGLAFDGDGDRLGVVDEQGAIRTSDELLLLLARDHLMRNPGASVVFTVSNSSLLHTEVTAWGGVPHMCKVGHSHVEHAMREHNAQLGGEQSGHFFCSEGYYGFDDALVAAHHVLQSTSAMSVSAAMSQFPRVYQAHEMRPHCPDDAKARVIASVVEHFSAHFPVNTLDGARIDFGEGAWAGIRQSNTSPRISICIEARSPEKLSQVEHDVLAHLKTYPEIVWE